MVITMATVVAMFLAAVDEEKGRVNHAHKLTLCSTKF